MELELKHLAAYLPYGLKVRHEGKIDIVNGHYFLKKDLWLMTEKTGNSLIKICNPILEPLSNLTKPITRNGVTFVAIEWFREKDFSHCDWISKEREHWVKVYSHDEWLNEIPFGMVQQLIEWKFDVFGLIEKGLAVECTNEYN